MISGHVEYSLGAAGCPKAGPTLEISWFKLHISRKIRDVSRPPLKKCAFPLGDDLEKQLFSFVTYTNEMAKIIWTVRRKIDWNISFEL